MITIRRANERGRHKEGLRDARYTFSFDGYFDPRHIGFRALRVINEMRAAGGADFGEQRCRDTEIITCVIEGSLEHKSILHGAFVVNPHEWQIVSAGIGAHWQECNASATKPLRFLQMWIIPDERGLSPNYKRKSLSPNEKNGRFRLAASADGRNDSLKIQQNVSIYNAVLKPDAVISYNSAENRFVWIQILKGEVTLNNYSLRAGDGASVSSDESDLLIVSKAESEILLFDLA